MNTIGPPHTNWYLTPFGHRVLAYLIDYPEHPNHRRLDIENER